MENEDYDFERDMETLDREIYASIHTDVTISIDSEVHRKLKVIASVKGYTLDSTINEFLSKKFKDIDMAELVKNYLKTPLSELKAQQKSSKRKDNKRVTVSILKSIHKKLKIISSARGISLDKVASEMVEEAVNEIDIVKFIEESLE